MIDSHVRDICTFFNGKEDTIMTLIFVVLGLFHVSTILSMVGYDERRA